MVNRLCRVASPYRRSNWNEPSGPKLRLPPSGGDRSKASALWAIAPFYKRGSWFIPNGELLSLPPEGGIGFAGAFGLLPILTEWVRSSRYRPAYPFGKKQPGARLLCNRSGTIGPSVITEEVCFLSQRERTNTRSTPFGGRSNRAQKDRLCGGLADLLSFAAPKGNK